MPRYTEVSIRGEQFFINGAPTYKGRVWNNHRIEGLLLNSRMAQGIFDDQNPQTRRLWNYPDTGIWDPERNTREFLAAMPIWRSYGLLAFTVNLQGGNPYGYTELDKQALENSAINPDGSLRPDYMARLERILDRADELGMVVILGIFYFGQEKCLRDETAIIQAVDNVIDWLFARDYRNVIVEINNECNVIYKQPILQPERVHELILRARSQVREGRRFLVSTSYGGSYMPKENVMRAADLVLMHGNSVEDPSRIAESVRQVRAMPWYTPMPIVFNEDDHFDFDKPWNNFVAALSEYASWGYFDFRRPGETFADGFQSVPVDWGINSPRKHSFFNLLKEITGA